MFTNKNLEKSIAKYTNNIAGAKIITEDDPTLFENTNLLGLFFRSFIK